MKGYFDRLAGQMSSSRPVRAASVAPLEQVVEVEAPTDAAASHAADVSSAETTPTSPLNTRRKARRGDEHTTESLTKISEHAAPLESRHDTATRSLEAASTIERTRNNEPIGAPSIQVARAPVPSTAMPATADSTLRVDASDDRRVEPASAASSTAAAQAPSTPFSTPFSTTAPSSHSQATSDTRLRTPSIPESARPVHAVHAQAAVKKIEKAPVVVAAPAPSVVVRIGSISLEVHTPAPPPPVAPPVMAQPAPAPIVQRAASAPTARFSPHRHYLRWG